MELLRLKQGETVVDGTLGSGGHACEMLEAIGPQGRLIGLDQDPDAIQRCRRLFEGLPNVTLQLTNFRALPEILEHLKLREVDAVLLDIGCSSNQLEDAARGFSFNLDGPLDMRMNPESDVTAADLVNRLRADRLEAIFRDYGNERWARRFAHTIEAKRREQRIETTADLVRVLDEALPRMLRSTNKGRRPPQMRMHPATRVFQALRIAVNGELSNLEEGLPLIWDRLRIGGRMAVISFHSLEDRIVKNFFRNLVQKKHAEYLTKKPIVPTIMEIQDNPRARSAKLRAALKTL